MSRLRLSLCLLLLVLAGCATTISGRYSLQTVNAEPLPLRFFDGEEVTAAYLQLNNDETCRLIWWSRTAGGSVTEESDEDCTWNAIGTAVTVTVPAGDPSTGSVVDDELTLTDLDEGDVLVFVKR